MATTSTSTANSAPANGNVCADSIVSSDDICGGRPRIAGTRIRVSDVYVWHELRGQSVDQIVAAFPQVTHAQVHSALAYYFSHAAEIVDDMNADEQLVADMQRQFGPGPLAEKLAKAKTDAPDNSISSR